MAQCSRSIPTDGLLRFAPSRWHPLGTVGISMTTWGQPKKRSKTTTTAKRPPAKAAPAAAPSSTRRGQASSELRQAIEGREHEFAGIGFIVAGVLLGMAI